MYIMNGIVYGKESQENIKAAQVKPFDNQTMLITFSSGETRLFDATILTGEVFEPLKNIDIFKDPAIENGVVTWCNGDIDCSPGFMYNNSYEYSVVM